ncbi:complement factor B-like isoform X2 [Pyxicephalus adspersus]|uniref:complement factor B-like isoform X2 n=1 Tax=Pyxicephalus adspersus TaxID=30357 RepID=UPI003B58EF60
MQQRSSAACRMILLLLLSHIAVSIAAPAVQCDLSKVSINGGNYTVNDDGDKVEYRCPKGKYPFPVVVRQCQWNRKWTKEKEQAECRDVQCPRPGTFDNGDYTPKEKKYFVGDVLNFQCWDGFTLDESQNRTCQENGKWSGQTAICKDQDSYCPNPGTPMGATKVGSSYRIEGKVIYQCLDGLKMVGSKERVCQENGKWSGTEPSCRLIDPRFVKVKTGGLMNIFIIIDASKSVGLKNFNTAKGIAETFIEKISSFDFTPRYSVLTYATQIKRIVTLSDEDNVEPDEVIKKIKAFSYKEHDDKQGTNTRGALKEVYDQLSLFQLRNPDIFLNTSNVILLMTDGKFNMGGDPVVEVKRIREFLDIKSNNYREDKLDIYVFGLGSDISFEELNDIASRKDSQRHVFKMASIDDLKEAFDHIIDETDALEMCGISKYHSNDVKEKYPWIASVVITRPGEVENCKATVITRNFLLTAAHCFHLDDPVHFITVQVGTLPRKVKDVYRHPKYDPNSKKDKNVPRSFEYDLALVEMDSKIDFSPTIRPICLPCTSGASWALKLRDKAVSCSDHEKLLLTGELVRAMFVSEEKKGNFMQMDVLIKQGGKRLDCLEDAKKVKEFEDVADIRDIVTDNFLCTGGTEPEVDPQTCKGDSGGPLIIQHNKRNIQVGVISWGTVVSCDGHKRRIPVPAGSRDFHAEIVHSMDWIEQVVKNELIYLK